MQLFNGDVSDFHHQDRNAPPPPPPPPPPRGLPNEILTLIINHLSGQRKTLYECTLVNKQFHIIANPFLWQVLNFYDDNIDSEHFLHCISNASPQRLALIGHHICDMVLFGDAWTDAQLTRLLPHIPNLKHVSIYNKGTRITDTSFQHLPWHCQQLTSLTLVSTHLTHVSFSAIGQHCHQLRHLHWTTSTSLSPEWLEMLTACPLASLKLASFDLVLNEKAMAAMKTFDQLTCLDITRAPPAHTKSLLLATTTTTTSNQIPEKDNGTTLWPHLTKLSLSFCDHLDDTTMVCFITSHPHLQELELTGAYQLTDTTLDAMTGLPKLTDVALTRNANISSDGVRRLVRRCCGLVCVNFSYCDRLVPGSLYSDSGHSLMLDQEAMDKIRQEPK